MVSTVFVALVYDDCFVDLAVLAVCCGCFMAVVCRLSLK